MFIFILSQHGSMTLRAYCCGACWPGKVMVGQEQPSCTYHFSVQFYILCLCMGMCDCQNPSSQFSHTLFLPETAGECSLSDLKVPWGKSTARLLSQMVLCGLKGIA